MSMLYLRSAALNLSGLFGGLMRPRLRGKLPRNPQSFGLPRCDMFALISRVGVVLVRILGRRHRPLLTLKPVPLYHLVRRRVLRRHIGVIAPPVRRLFL